MDAEMQTDMKWLLDYVYTRFFPDSPEVRTANRIAAWLAAQPARWRPVEDGTYAAINGDAVHVEGHALRTDGLYRQGEPAYLPDYLRLCRREPQP